MNMSDATDTNDPPVSVEISIPFHTVDLATVAFNTLRVDKEPKRSSTTKSLSLDGNVLKVSFTSGETRQLRTAISSFMELLILVSKTLDEFAPDDFKI